MYDALQKTPTKKLVRKNDKGEIVWNWRYYCILLLISTWTGFYHIHAKFHAPALLRKKDLLGYTIKLYCKANPSILEAQAAVHKIRSLKYGWRV